MERINTLIDKLYQQKGAEASPAHLLFTVQLLQQELAQLQTNATPISRNKVAVTLPACYTYATVITDIQSEEATQKPTLPETKEIFVLDAVIEDSEEEIVQPIVEVKEYTLRKPLLPEEFYRDSQYKRKEEPQPAYSTQSAFNSAFDTITEAPTLTQYAVRKEVQHSLAEVKESLNDRLKEERPEVAHRLNEAPVKDLRKAIGINDRFVFLNQLFRGDEAMYERSIKTINGFNIYSEAEYWMARELKLKLAWADSHEAVQQFYSLVRRRFS